jgi:phosphatidylserine decarboxylase
VFAPSAGRYLGPVAAAFLLLLAAALLLRPPLLGVALAGTIVVAGLGLFLAWFFRDPERTAGEGIVSAADGRVLAVTDLGGRTLIAVFMNVTDVHVNRFPTEGRVERVEDSGTGYRPAYAPEATHNVARSYRIATALGPIEVVQRTGLVARRLVSLVRPGDARAKGERLGMILLGSRVDVLLPTDRVTPLVRVGDRVRAGETAIARELP